MPLVKSFTIPSLQDQKQAMLKAGDIVPISQLETSFVQHLTLLGRIAKPGPCTDPSPELLHEEKGRKANYKGPLSLALSLLA